MGRHPIEMVGHTFGVLSVLSEAEGSTPRTKMFNVQCHRCGKCAVMLGGNIRRSAGVQTGGCKCIPVETVPQFTYAHGLSGHPLYKVWEGMLARCCNPNHVAFARYGGRGIDVCERWSGDVTAFAAWAEGAGWRPGLQLDREDNDRGYSPENCRFVEGVVNANNRSNNRRIEVGGRSFTIAQASREFGVKKTTIKERLNRGWSADAAVSPVSR